VAFVESNWLTPYKTRALTVTGSDAIMRLDYITQELWIEAANEKCSRSFRGGNR